MKRYALILAFYCTTGAAQSFDDYRARYERLREGDALALREIRSCIAKAKKEKNGPELVRAYHDALHFSPTGKLAYADSLIEAATRTGNSGLIAGAYLTRGTVYYFNYRKFQPALDEYLKAWPYTRQSRDPYLYHKNLYHIGVVRSYLGAYTEAQAHFEACRYYFEQELSRAKHPNRRHNLRKGYLNTLHQLGALRLAQGRDAEAAALADRGLREVGAGADYGTERSLFLKLKGISAHRQGRHEASLALLDAALPGLLKKDDFTNASLVWFYSGKSAAALQRTREAERFFLKVDSVFRVHRFILPEVRPAYEELIMGARRAGNLNAELHFTTRLLEADRLIGQDFRYLSRKLYREFDTAGLRREKRRLELALYPAYGLAVLLGVMLPLMLRRHHLKRKKQTNRETEGPDLPGSASPIPVTDAEQPRTLKNSKLTEETARELLLKIESLELQQFYLDPEISQNVMATLLKTNTAYLSDTINTYKGNNFTGYINGLRIGYITQMLRERGIWRHYSVGTLALEAGFKNRVTFSQAFKHHQRMSVRTYIEQLNRERRGAVDW